MFTKIIIENILGINNKIEMNFMATPKKKEKKETIVEIEKNVNVNKINGIIGANASGKTSIINSLLELRVFLAQYEIIDNAKKKNDENILKLLSSDDFLPDRNIENLEKNSEITLEMFIPTGEIPGFYTYSLILNDEKLNEKLIYRKKFRSKKSKIIENYYTDSKRSDIGYKCFYKDSILKDYEKVGKQLVNKFNDTLRYYNTFYKYYIGDSIYPMGITNFDYINIEETVNFIKNNEDIIVKLLKIVDSKIVRVVFENDENGDEVVRFVTKNDKKLDIWNLSTGTNRTLQLLIMILKTINNNGIMLCDEIETALHKELVQLIIKLFLKSNNYSQLIFTTHLPEILDEENMRNDQKFYLSSEKDGKVKIEKISQINPRSDYSISKNYYTDIHFMPQPTEKQINDFCDYVFSKNKKK